MITERGKTILGKYMAGQNESTFSYLAIGIGAKPAFSTNIVEDADRSAYGDWAPPSSSGDRWSYYYYPEPATNPSPVDKGFVPEYTKIAVDSNDTDGIIKYSHVNQLDYEVLRVPITESGVEFVKLLTQSDEAGNTYSSLTDIVLTGTLPSLGDYRFTEIGIYSAQSNAISSSKPSQVLFNFANVLESWFQNDGATTSAVELKENNVNPQDGGVGFYASGNQNFAGGKTQSRPRSGQSCLYLKNLSSVTHDASSFDFSNVRPDDEFRLAYFLDDTTYSFDHSYEYIVEVTFKDSNGVQARAKLRSNTKYFNNSDGGCIPSTYKNNRYGVALAQVKDFTITANSSSSNPDSTFSWSNVASITISTVLRTDSVNNNEISVFLDSFKYESTNYNNPNYGLVAYSVVQNRAATDTVNNDEIAIPDSLHKSQDLETLLQYRVRINNSLNGEDYLSG